MVNGLSARYPTPERSGELVRQPEAEAAEAEDAGQDERAPNGRQAAPQGEGADQVGGVGGRAEEEPAADLVGVAVLESPEEAGADDRVTHTEAAREGAHAGRLGVASDPCGRREAGQEEE